MLVFLVCIGLASCSKSGNTSEDDSASEEQNVNAIVQRLFKGAAKLDEFASSISEDNQPTDEEFTKHKDAYDKVCEKFLQNIKKLNSEEQMSAADILRNNTNLWLPRYTDLHTPNSEKIIDWLNECADKQIQAMWAALPGGKTIKFTDRSNQTFILELKEDSEHKAYLTMEGTNEPLVEGTWGFEPRENDQKWYILCKLEMNEGTINNGGAKKYYMRSSTGMFMPDQPYEVILIDDQNIWPAELQFKTESAKKYAKFVIPYTVVE